jgi:NADP-reducing hydrogenase subunit HndD
MNFFMNSITIKVNGVEISAPEGTTILQAVQQSGITYSDIDIPTLFYLKDVSETDDSGVCIVEVAGKDGLVPAWSCPISEGMEVLTKTDRLVETRKEALSKILASHDNDCINCIRTANCELQNLMHKYDVKDDKSPDKKKHKIDESSIVIRDNNRCVRCSRCLEACKTIQGIGAIDLTGEGLDAVVAPVSEAGLAGTSCVSCGQCIAVCPVGALYERDDTAAVAEAIADPEKFVIVQAAPAVRAALGEAFEFPLGVDVEGRLAAALRELGFNRVFDTKFGADLTVVEEAGEFVRRFESGGTLPMTTSCCPGWVKYCEHNFPDMLGNVSSCKSPQQMFGAIAKSYYAEKIGIDISKIVVVSVMPCTAKKFEIGRDNQSGAGVPDVDVSITTRELSRMLKEAEIQFEAMPAETFDDPLGIGTGAGVIFGATGGVMEAALRTAIEKLTGDKNAKLAFTEVRGVTGIKEASYDVGGKSIKVAAVSGLSNAKALLESVRKGEADYHFIEVMACPGGCVNGGGQPQQIADVRAKDDIRAVRAEALYLSDEKSTLRKSHENPAIIELYSTYLSEPGSEKAHSLLHTTYVKR